MYDDVCMYVCMKASAR